MSVKEEIVFSLTHDAAENEQRRSEKFDERVSNHSLLVRAIIWSPLLPQLDQAQHRVTGYKGLDDERVRASSQGDDKWEASLGKCHENFGLCFDCLGHFRPNGMLRISSYEAKFRCMSRKECPISKRS